MGAADVVPGVSGGTMALVLGIYGRFIGALGKLSSTLLPAGLTFAKGGFGKASLPAFKDAVFAADVPFLIFLGCGIVASFLSFAKVIPYLMDTYPQHMNGFFFGMIAASAIIPFRMMQRRRVVHLLVFHGAMLFAWWFSSLPVLAVEASPPFIFVCGAVAICAMLLPGVSGSFLLLVLGQYKYILTALRDRDLLVVSVFCAGCGLGLLTFSRFLSWLLARFPSGTLAVLCGLMVGSLQKVWPYKAGEQVLVEGKVLSAGENVLPWNPNFSGDAIGPALLLIVGVALVLGLEAIGRRRSTLDAVSETAPAQP